MKIILTEQDLREIVINVINEAGGRIYAANKRIDNLADSNNTSIGSGIMRSNGRFTTWQKILERMAELNPQIRNSMVQTYAKKPFHFCDRNESDIIIPIELRIFDIINITPNDATLLCQRIQQGDTKTIRVKTNFRNGLIYYQTNRGIKYLTVDKRYQAEWNAFYEQLTIAASSLE